MKKSKTEPKTTAATATNIGPIEDGIEMPNRLWRSKYPFADMLKVGQSFEVSGVKLQAMRGACYSAGKKLGKKFLARAGMPGTVRVWRTE